jgi:ABC-type oligopeptide transport system ATPase subunit
MSSMKYDIVYEVLELGTIVEMKIASVIITNPNTKYTKNHILQLIETSNDLT